jgi:hypothetical protein
VCKKQCFAKWSMRWNEGGRGTHLRRQAGREGTFSSLSRWLSGVDGGRGCATLILASVARRCLFSDKLWALTISSRKSRSYRRRRRTLAAQQSSFPRLNNATLICRQLRRHDSLCKADRGGEQRQGAAARILQFILARYDSTIGLVAAEERPFICRTRPRSGRECTVRRRPRSAQK